MFLELIRRCTAKGSKAFSNLCEKISFYLTYYHSLDYVCNQLRIDAVKARAKLQANNIQYKLIFLGPHFFEKTYADIDYQ